MKKGTIILLVILGIVFIGGCGACNKQKTMVSYDESVKASWANVETQYQRRSNLIGNLVNTVKGYAKHEQETLTKVIEARAKATQVTVDANSLTPENIEKMQAAQGELSQALGRLMVVSEQYPNLKADQQFLNLQNELTGTENRIATAITRYNEEVKTYNIYIRQIPNNIIAPFLGFQVKGEFKAEAGAEKPVNVEF